jgi:hypothetical protein
MLDFEVVMNIVLDFGMTCDVGSLKIAFPELFSIAHFNDAFVADHSQLSSDLLWNINFIRAVDN